MLLMILMPVLLSALSLSSFAAKVKVNVTTLQVRPNVDAIVYPGIEYLGGEEVDQVWSNLPDLKMCVTICLGYGHRCLAVNFDGKGNCWPLNAGIVDLKYVQDALVKRSKGWTHALIRREYADSLPAYIFPSPVITKRFEYLDPCYGFIYEDSMYKGGKISARPKTFDTWMKCAQSCRDWAFGSATVCRGVNYKYPYCYYLDRHVMNDMELLAEKEGYMHVLIKC